MQAATQCEIKVMFESGKRDERDLSPHHLGDFSCSNFRFQHDSPVLPRAPHGRTLVKEESKNIDQASDQTPFEIRKAERTESLDFSSFKRHTACRAVVRIFSAVQ